MTLFRYGYNINKISTEAIMDYMSTNQASELWSITQRRIAILCEQERISGAVKIGKTWMIPKNAQKPEDGRMVISNTNKTLVRGKYYLEKIKEHSYSTLLQQCIEESGSFCMKRLLSSDVSEEHDNEPLMMLGKIQSGKTRAFTGLIALLFDNNFDMVLILTKNSQALAKQTYKRMRQEFKNAIDEDEAEVFDIMKKYDTYTDFELEKKIIIIAKKEKTNLDYSASFITDYVLHQRKNCLIIDDEADACGIGFMKAKNTDDEFDLSTIAQKVNEIRGNLKGCVFVQVTATPYALYLQPEFNKSKIEPIKPKKTVLVPSGDGYIGGEYYFIESQNDDDPARFIFAPVSDEENMLVSDQKKNGKKSKINDRRSFKEENILTDRRSLEVFKKGFMNFVVGGCVLNLIKGKYAKYSYVIHTATQKTSHIRLESIANTIGNQIKERNEYTEPIVEAMFSEAYYDIKRSVEAYDYIMPNFDDTRISFLNAIDKGYISITVVNSDKDMETVLDEDTGELKLRTPFSIFVGGQALDRGVTIPKMIGFYYGRNPRTMQQDTVLQHSRMFGYRNNELLSVTRFYTTRRIYDNMTKITEFDAALREDIEKDTFKDGIVFIQKYSGYKTDDKGARIKDAIIPCSPDKIALSNVILMKPQARVLPIGFTPVAKASSAKISKEVNNELLKIIPESQRDPILVSVDVIEPILHHIYDSIRKDEDSERFVTADRFISVMNYLARQDKEIYLLVRRNRAIEKFKKNGTTIQDGRSRFIRCLRLG